MSHLYFNGVNSAFRLVSALGGRDIIPSYDSSGGVNPRMRVAQFGEGYQQRSEDGINNLPATFDLTFGHVTSIQAKELRAFFLGIGSFYPRISSEYFYWTPPAPFDDDGTAYKFIYSNLKISFVQFNDFNVSVTFTQVFEP